MSDRCDRYRVAVSAALDGEDPGLEAAVLDAHLRRCGSCRRFTERAGQLHRDLRLRAAEPVPDLTGAILARLPSPVPARAPAGVAGLRGLLALVGLLQLGSALPGLVAGQDGAMSGHAARHLASFGAALGLAFLLAAWRPARVSGMLPVVGALGLLLVVTAMADVASGRVEAATEAHHVGEVVGVLLCWMLARATAPRRGIALA